MQPDDPHEKVRTIAIIQSLERMCTELRTAKVHADATNAVLQDLLATAQKRIAELEKALEEATKPQPAAANGALHQPVDTKQPA